MCDRSLCAVFQLIGSFDLNMDGKVSFGEFVQSLWHLQKEDDHRELQRVSVSIRGTDHGLYSEMSVPPERVSQRHAR